MALPTFLAHFFPIGNGTDGFRRLSHAFRLLLEKQTQGAVAELPTATSILDFYSDGFGNEWLDIYDHLTVRLDNSTIYKAYNKSERHDIGFEPDWILDYSPDSQTGDILGDVKATILATPPQGWLFMQGQELSRTTYSELFIEVGTTYGAGDGSTTFNLPDLRGRTVIGSGAGGGLTSRTIGDVIGEEDHALTESENAAHFHNVKVAAFSGGISTFDGYRSNSGSPTPRSGQFLQASGGSVPHNNMQPCIVLNWIVFVGV